MSADLLAEYRRRGWALVPVPAGRKGTIAKDWQIRAFGPADFPPGGNVAVILGPRSGELVDIDLDCPEALGLADLYLPQTGAEFGRPSKPRSHRLFVSTGAVFELVRRPDLRRNIARTARSGHHRRRASNVAAAFRRGWRAAGMAWRDHRARGLRCHEAAPTLRLSRDGLRAGSLCQPNGGRAARAGFPSIALGGRPDTRPGSVSLARPARPRCAAAPPEAAPGSFARGNRPCCPRRRNSEPRRLGRVEPDWNGDLRRVRRVGSGRGRIRRLVGKVAEIQPLCNGGTVAEFSPITTRSHRAWNLNPSGA